MYDSFADGRNLALLPGVDITTSVIQPAGGGARTPTVLLNDAAHRLHGRPMAEFSQARAFDTFRGRNLPNELDWYRIAFPRPVSFNCVEMTMGFPFRDGGWWTSLAVETQAGPDAVWQPVVDLQITPPYPFADSRLGRRPFQTYTLVFEDVNACALRLAGVPGGLARFTSLGRLAVYQRERSRWRPAVTPSPVPYELTLVSADSIWDLSESLVKVTGLDVGFPQFDYFLDEMRTLASWARIEKEYYGERSLWMLLGDTLGWDNWPKSEIRCHTFRTRLDPPPYLALTFDELMVNAVAPVAVDGTVLFSLTSGQALLAETHDPARHYALAAASGLSWEEYSAAATRMPHMSLAQMEGVAELMGLIANAIARLAHRASTLEGELRRAHVGGGANAVRRAVIYIDDHLEEPLAIGSIADAVGLHPAYFSTLFTTEVGCTPSEYLMRRRVERAKEYFRYTNMNVMDVAVALGYSPSYFTRLFRRHTGLTPGEYAARARG